MSKRQKKTKPERDKGESILDSTSKSSEYSDSRTVLEDHEDFYLAYRVADYCRRYPEDAGAGHEFIVFMESVTEQPLGSRDMLTLKIIKLAKGDNESQLNRMTQIEQDTFEMQVRAANIGIMNLLLYIKNVYHTNSFSI
ncbi:unnamed protein product [Leptidea sinapis]|uniref:Uncharacterized protein n=1 Tax=Leptidea sinapis TaxID=189913 RepID=A0A5E4Q2C1_9NEOP|nr:unnamed protein product [Leptidea sinapis]